MTVRDPGTEWLRVRTHRRVTPAERVESATRNRTATFQTGIQVVSLAGYIGQPEALPPDTRVIRLAGPVSAVELASVIKTATNLSKLGQSAITLDLRLELKGDVDKHSVLIATNELQAAGGGVAGGGCEGGRSDVAPRYSEDHRYATEEKR